MTDLTKWWVLAVVERCRGPAIFHLHPEVRGCSLCFGDLPCVCMCFRWAHPLCLGILLPAIFGFVNPRRFNISIVTAASKGQTSALILTPALHRSPWSCIFSFVFQHSYNANPSSVLSSQFLSLFMAPSLSLLCRLNQTYRGYHEMWLHSGSCGICCWCLPRRRF